MMFCSCAHTFLRQLLVVDQFSVPQVVEDGAKVGGVSVNDVRPRLVLWQTHSQSGSLMHRTERSRQLKGGMTSFKDKACVTWVFRQHC